MWGGGEGILLEYHIFYMQETDGTHLIKKNIQLLSLRFEIIILMLDVAVLMTFSNYHTRY